MHYSERVVQEISENGRASAEQESTSWRRDACGAWIRRDHYGTAQSEFGWEIENISVAGTGESEHLRPCAPARMAKAPRASAEHLVNRQRDFEDDQSDDIPLEAQRMPTLDEVEQFLGGS